MLDAFGNDKSLLWLQINRAIFKIDDEVPLQDKEELIVVVMFVPVVFALHDSQANNGVVHLAERLVIPLLGAGFYQSPERSPSGEAETLYRGKWRKDNLVVRSWARE